MESNNNDPKELIHKTETASKIPKPNLQLPKAKCWEVGKCEEVGINIYTRLYIKEINNKDQFTRINFAAEINLFHTLNNLREKRV